MIRNTAIASIALLAAACSGPPTETSSNPGGKVDAPASSSDPRCDTASRDESGTCRLENGQFAFDICCSEDSSCTVAAEEPACLFGDTSRDMKAAVYLSAASTGHFLTLDELGDIQEAHLEEGLEADGTFSLDELFEFVDDDGIETLAVAVAESDAGYIHYRMFFGDTEVGYIFDDATGELAALIGDQDISRCTAPLPAVFDFRCGASPSLCTLTDSEISRCVAEEGDAMGCLDFHDDELLTSCCTEHDTLLDYCQVIPGM